MTHDELLRELAPIQTLAVLVPWALRRNPAAEFVEVVVQDEFTHDVMVPWRDGLVLVYETTCLGGITAVAIWDHHPTADELLQARLDAGWLPRPSLLKSGDRVVGHAACSDT